MMKLLPLLVRLLLVHHDIKPLIQYVNFEEYVMRFYTQTSEIATIPTNLSIRYNLDVCTEEREGRYVS